MRSTSYQNYGRYYIEFTVGSMHGRNDCVGLMVARVSGFTGMVSAGQACAAVYQTGAISGTFRILAGRHRLAVRSRRVTWSRSRSISPSKNRLEGGLVWLRRNGEPWNGELAGDPVAGEGGLGLVGYNFSERWVPAVGFGGPGATPGDNVTANFGQQPFVRKPPAGFAVWSSVPNDGVQVMPPEAAVPSDDEFFSPGIELSTKTLSHPLAYIVDDDAVYPTTSFGGTLMLYVNTVVDAPDAVHPAGYLTTYDGTPSTNVTMSNSNRTATATGAFANIGVRSRAQQNIGKYYFEVTYGQRTGNFNVVGVATENATFNNIVTDLFNATEVTPGNGNIYSNNTSTGRSLGTINAGSVVSVAIDLDVRRAWFRKDGGNWNNTVGADPTLGVAGGGVTMASLASFSPSLGFGGGTVAGDSMTGNFGQAAFIHAPPVGFGRWPGTSTSQYLLPATVLSDDDHKTSRLSPANLFPILVPNDDSIPLISGTGGTPTIGPNALLDDLALTELIHAPNIGVTLTSLDGALSAGVSLSPDKLTATHTSTASNVGARSSALKTVGKFYFEVTMTAVHGDSDSCGLITSIGTFTNFVNSGQQCLAIYKWSGQIYANNGSSGFSLGACTSGDVISVAVDLATRKAWMRKNGGLWNGAALATQNPNTGIGGVTLNATASYSPAVGFGGTNTAISDAMTVNFGGTSFIYPAPTNFDKWNA